MQRYAPFVPARIIRPYLLAYLNSPTGSLRELSTATGVAERRLYDIMRTQEKVSFPVADRILTGMGLALEWHQNETLHQIYESVV